MANIIEGNLRADGKKFAIIVARYNSFISEKLLEGALDSLIRSGALDADIDISTGHFLRGKLIAAQQTGYGIPKIDETGEGFKLVRSLTNEDFPENEIIFTKTGGIYNNQIIPPAVRPREEYIPSFRFIGK